MRFAKAFAPGTPSGGSTNESSTLRFAPRGEPADLLGFF
jgi:hypothetical protein